MAVKVISGENLREVECWRCGAKLAYVYTDIKEDVQTDYTGGRDSYSYIDCPCCNQKVKVKK